MYDQYGDASGNPPSSFSRSPSGDMNMNSDWAQFSRQYSNPTSSSPFDQPSFEDLFNAGPSRRRGRRRGGGGSSHPPGSIADMLNEMFGGVFDDSRSNANSFSSHDRSQRNNHQPITAYVKCTLEDLCRGSVLTLACVITQYQSSVKHTI